MAEFISPEKQAFLHSNIDDNFGLSIDDVAKNVQGQSRFKHLLNDNIDNIKKVLKIVEDAGMSPAFFGAYEINEGYVSQFGWLNHTDYTGDPYDDAKSVAEHMVATSQKMDTIPAWVDVGTNNLDFVPQDIKQMGNADFKDMAKGTIGRAYIPNTAAATWDAYYPIGLKAEYNGVQDYGRAISDAFESIKSWGGQIGKGNNNDNNDEKQPVKQKNARHIALRKNGKWKNKSYENYDTVKEENEGQNRLRKNGWRQVPKMNNGKVD